MENNHNNQNYLCFNIICQFAIDVLRNHETNISQLLIPLYFGNLFHDIPHKSTCISVRFFDMSTCCFHTDLLNFCMYISLPSEEILEQILLVFIGDIASSETNQPQSFGSKMTSLSLSIFQIKI